MSNGNGVKDPDEPTETSKACDNGWADALGHARPYPGDTPDEQRERSDHGRPVDDGPGQHRSNARTDHSPTRPGKVQDF